LEKTETDPPLNFEIFKNRNAHPCEAKITANNWFFSKAWGWGRPPSINCQEGVSERITSYAFLLPERVQILDDAAGVLL
jgi:hypothetical protein